MASSKEKKPWYRRAAEAAHAHFVPSERNGHVPHVLKHRVLVGYSLILILVKVLAVTGYVLLPASSVYSSAVTADNIVELANAARTSLGLKELKVDGRLAHAATEKAEDMVLNQYFAHTSPAGVTPWYWIRKNGYVYLHAGENLAVNYFEAEGVQQGWMASPGHRDNIISTKYDDIGVGVARGTYEGFDTVFVVEMFGAPQQPVAAPSAKPAPAPAPDPVVAPQIADVQPTSTGYKVTMNESRVEAATAMIADQAVVMRKDDEGRLAADVPVDKATVKPDGEPVYVIVDDAASGTKDVAAVALVAPNARAGTLFSPAGQDRPFKLFGLIEISGLDDAVRRFYVVMGVLLGAVLLASVVVKFEIQRHTVTLHALFVIALAVTMAVI